MIFKQFYDRALAQSAYMVGCAASGEALVIDPARDITPYLEAARQEGLRITQVTETHIHADYVSGSRELAHATGATLYLSATGDADWQYQFGHEQVVWLEDGAQWQVGNVGLQVLATPGHTPEHLVFMLTDHAQQDVPVGLFTGDCLFVGSVGRPDLLEKAAGLADTAAQLAHQQFHSLQRLQDLPDHLQIWPGHGAGSACGKSLSAMPFSTLGYERLTNPGLQFLDAAAFADWLLADQPEAPRYFARMKQVNKEGPPLLDSLTPICQLHIPRLQAALAAGEQIIDTRPGDQFAAGHLPGTLHIPSSSQYFNTYMGWFVDYDRPLYLIADPHLIEARLAQELRAIGVDNIHGYWTPAAVKEAASTGQIETTPQIDAATLAQHPQDYHIIDVRGADEYAQSHISGATHIMYGELPAHINDLPDDKPLVTYCETGVRSQIAVSLLLKHGVQDIYNLRDGYEAWQALQPQAG